MVSNSRSIPSGSISYNQWISRMEATLYFNIDDFWIPGSAFHFPIRGNFEGLKKSLAGW